MPSQQRTREKKPVAKKRDYVVAGNPMNSKEFLLLVKEADESGYMSADEFNKRCLELNNKSVDNK